jgi:hypothetical protein
VPLPLFRHPSSRTKQYLLTSPNWLILFGKNAAIRTDRRRATGWKRNDGYKNKSSSDPFHP